MEKKLKNFKLTDDIIKELQEIASILNITETEVVSRAIHTMYLQIKSEEKSTISGAIVPLSEYQRVRDALDNIILKLGEAQGELNNKDKIIIEKERIIEEKEKQINDKNEIIKAKDETIQSLKNRLRDYMYKKPWWKFWD
ncbi:hypothetical protein [Hydrogenobaculum acidophilum]